MAAITRTRRRTGETALTRGEYEKLLRVCNTLEEELLLKIGVSLGLRRGDMSHLRITDIDFMESTLSYYEEKKDRIRTVPIGNNLKQLLTKYVHTIPKTQETIFPFSDRTAHRRFWGLCDRAGIKRRPIHALRATCIKFCQAAGWTPEQVSELTGDTIRVIQEHYATPSKAEMSEVMVEKEVI